MNRSASIVTRRPQAGQVRLFFFATRFMSGRYAEMVSVPIVALVRQLQVIASQLHQLYERRGPVDALALPTLNQVREVGVNVGQLPADAVDVKADVSTLPLDPAVRLLPISAKTELVAELAPSVAHFFSP